MSRSIHDRLLFQLSELAETRFGLSFPQERWRDLERHAREYLSAIGGENPGALERLLSPSPPAHEVEAFGNHLTIGETRFFREKRGLEILVEEIVPNWLCRRGVAPLRIWSAGCATGEEPYSIAMALFDAFPELADGRAAIFGTDLNTDSLRAADEGLYRRWSFRSAPLAIQIRHFDATEDGRWAISSAIRKAVRFGYYNLAGAGDPPWFTITNAVDVIFCRNVLMYLNPSALRKAVEALYRLLDDGGWLVVSPVETSTTVFANFESVRFSDLTLYRKGQAAPAVWRPVAAALFDPPPAAGVQEDEASDFRAPIPPVEIPPEAPAEIEAGPAGDAQAILQLARRHADEGRLKEAADACRKSIEADPVNARAYYLSAAVAEEQGSFDEAALLLRKSLYLEPGLVLGYFALGNLALRRGRARESVKCFENAMSLLAAYRPEDVLPESGGLTAGRLRELALSQAQAACAGRRGGEKP